MFIVLTGGLKAIIDDDDYERINQFKWHAMKTDHKIYARRGHLGKVSYLLMHRMVTVAKPGVMIDHINGNGLDNRKGNLRVCNPLQNSRNRYKFQKATSVYKGVHWHTKNKKWRAVIKDKKHVHLGCFDSEIEAALAYNQAAIKYFGEFANLNKILPNNQLYIGE